MAKDIIAMSLREIDRFRIVQGVIQMEEKEKIHPSTGSSMEETQSFSPPQLVPRKGYLDERQTGHFYVAKIRTFSLCLDRFDSLSCHH